MDKKASKKNINFSVFVKRFLVLGLAVYICVSLISQQFSLAKLSKEEKILDKQITEAQKAAKELEDEKELAETDEYKERVARERLGYMKKNEKVFIDTNK